MAPVMRDPPLCTLKELSDGTYTFNDLADMHEAMAEEAEIRRRIRDRDRDPEKPKS
jgi:hypothetical protein